MLRSQLMSTCSSQLEQEQFRSLAELGYFLRCLREDQGLSLDDVAATTKIQVRLLRAIEEGNLHQLPEPVYIRGFLKRYADSLGLDGGKFATAFPESTPEPRSLHSAWKDSPAAQLRPIHLYVAYIALITVAVSGLSFLMDRSTWNSATAPSKPTEQLSPRPAESGSTVPQSATGSSAIEAQIPSVSTPNAPNKAVRVDMTLTSQSWLRIDVDGKTEFQGILPEGTQKTLVADARITIRAGNAGGVLVALNQGKAEPMGEMGTVRERTFTPEQQAASLVN